MREKLLWLLISEEFLKVSPAELKDAPEADDRKSIDASQKPQDSGIRSSTKPTIGRPSSQKSLPPSKDQTKTVAAAPENPKNSMNAGVTDRISSGRAHVKQAWPCQGLCCKLN